MTMLKKLLKEKTPFAVMQYFENFKFNKSNGMKHYELIYLKNLKLKYKKLDRDDVRFLNQNLDVMKIVINDSNGKIYEFNDFKKHKEEVFNLQSKKWHLSIDDFANGITDLEEVFVCYGQAYMLTGSINKSEHYLGNTSEGEQHYDDKLTFNDLALFYFDDNDDLIELNFSEKEIIDLVF